MQPLSRIRRRRCLRQRIAERHDADPAAIAVANGSCEFLLAAGAALCEQGDEVVYAWPSFSIYPYVAPLSGAREIRVPLTDGDEHDLDAMLAEITAATQLVIVCNPNNPTSTHIPIARIAEFVERGARPRRRDARRGVRRVPAPRRPGGDASISGVAPEPGRPRTFSKCYGLAGLRVGYALCSAKIRAALDAVRQPFSVNALAQAAGAEAIRHSGRCAQRVERTIVERIFVEEGVRELGLETPDSHANFSWIDLGEADEAEVVAALGEKGVIVRPGAPLGGPGHIRVSYGTREQNQRFLDALRRRDRGLTLSRTRTACC